MPTIEWDAAKRERLRKAYNEAKAAKAKEFMFDGHAFVTDYAKSLLEWLDMKIKEPTESDDA